MKKGLLLIVSLLFCVCGTRAQLGGALQKAAQKAVKKTTDKVIDKTTDAAADAAANAVDRELDKLRSNNSTDKPQQSSAEAVEEQTVASIMAQLPELPSVQQLVRNLSGGNQQKVVLAKVLLADTDIIIFDEPTRGIDVNAKAEIYNIMNDLSADGMSIIMVSSEMPELMGVCDRIMVMYEGRFIDEFTRDEFDETAIARAQSGIRVHAN